MSIFLLRSFALAAFAVLALSGTAAPAWAGETPRTGPSATVARLNGVLLETMREADTLGYRGRVERLAPILEETFDFRLMAAISVGRYWRKLDPDEQARLVSAFAGMSIATFAARFNGYSGEHFEIVGEESGRRDTVLVRNRIVKSNGEAVPINFLLKREDRGWRAVDVYLDAKYSELAIKRSEYTSVIAKEGLDGLIRRIEAKKAELASEG